MLGIVNGGTATSITRSEQAVRSSYLKSILGRNKFADGLGRYKILGNVDQLAPGIEGIGSDLNFSTHDAE